MTLETLRVLLQKGADPNAPPDLLAYAVNFLPFDVCKFLLDKGANPNSAFSTEHFSALEGFSDKHAAYNRDFNQGRETALHAAARIGSQRKINLLLQLGAYPRALWIGETYIETKQKYAKLSSQRIYTIPSKLNNGENVNIVRSCRQFMYKTETRLIAFYICKTMTKICNRLSECITHKFVCKVSGSFLEKTKCFKPDELDFVFWTKSKIDVERIHWNENILQHRFFDSIKPYINTFS